MLMLVWIRFVLFQATPRLLDSKRVITELPDPRLDGKFPEQEMHIMAYLAKECLQLDPDDRPTMSEVVQILSAIAPERSRRRIISVSLFWLTFSYPLKTFGLTMQYKTA